MLSPVFKQECVMFLSSALRSAILLTVAAAAAAQSAPQSPDEHSGHTMSMSAAGSMMAPSDSSLPAGAMDAAARLAASPRHREYVMISTGPTDSIGVWIMYPERKTKAPVVLVVHEIWGVSTWVKAVGDQFAAQGFIAIVPDLLTGKRLPGGPDSMSVDSARVLISQLKPEDVQRQLIAIANYGMKLPAALPRYGIVGFCWGGGVSFRHAAAAPAVSAAVVYYGVAPDSTMIGKVHAPVLGLYGENDARIDVTIMPADSVLRSLKQTYDHYIFTGAGHGFLRDQTGKDGANMKATQDAWPKTIAWFKKYLEK
jgi:carboxymethylenebutenolidase